jgi:hypothetical protein
MEEIFSFFNMWKRHKERREKHEAATENPSAKLEVSLAAPEVEALDREAAAAREVREATETADRDADPLEVLAVDLKAAGEPDEVVDNKTAPELNPVIATNNIKNALIKGMIKSASNPNPNMMTSFVLKMQAVAAEFFLPTEGQAPWADEIATMPWYKQQAIERNTGLRVFQEEDGIHFDWEGEKDPDNTPPIRAIRVCERALGVDANRSFFSKLTDPETTWETFKKELAPYNGALALVDAVETVAGGKMDDDEAIITFLQKEKNALKISNLLTNRDPRASQVTS